MSEPRLTMGLTDLLTFFTLIVALSAYLASIRLAGIERLTQLKEKIDEWKALIPPKDTSEIERQRGRVKERLHYLLWADIPITLSAVLVGWHIFYSDWMICYVPGLVRWSILLFTVGTLAMVVSHAGAWRTSLRA